MLCENYGKIQPIHKTSNLNMELIKLTREKSEMCKL